MTNASPQHGVLNLRRTLWVIAGLILVLAMAQLAVQGWLKLPVCGWRWLTGLPCPFCGGVRCLDAVSHGDFLRALALNPLILIGLIAGLFWPLSAHWRNFLQTHTPKHWKPCLAAIVLLHWIYLIAVFH